MSEWYYSQGNDQRQGPLSNHDLIAEFRYGRVNLETPVWRDGQSQWQPLRDFATELGLTHLAHAPLSPSPLRSVNSPARYPPRTAKAGMPGYAIALTVIGVLAIPVVGILAFTLPSYQDYVARVQMAALFSAADSWRVRVAGFRERHQACPNNRDLGVRVGEVAAKSGRMINSIMIGPLRNGHCGVELRMIKTNSAPLQGKALLLEYDSSDSSWRCSSEVDDSYLPAQCRSQPSSP